MKKYDEDEKVFQEISEYEQEIHKFEIYEFEDNMKKCKYFSYILDRARKLTGIKSYDYQSYTSMLNDINNYQSDDAFDRITLWIIPQIQKMWHGTKSKVSRLEDVEELQAKIMDNLIEVLARYDHIVEPNITMWTPNEARVKIVEALRWKHLNYINGKHRWVFQSENAGMPRHANTEKYMNYIRQETLSCDCVIVQKGIYEIKVKQEVDPESNVARIKRVLTKNIYTVEKAKLKLRELECIYLKQKDFYHRRKKWPEFVGPKHISGAEVVLTSEVDQAISEMLHEIAARLDRVDRLIFGGMLFERPQYGFEGVPRVPDNLLAAELGVSTGFIHVRRNRLRGTIKVEWDNRIKPLLEDSMDFTPIGILEADFRQRNMA